MRRFYKLLISCFLLFFCCVQVSAATIVLYEKSAVAWLPQQTIRGELMGFTAHFIRLHQDSGVYIVPVINHVFNSRILLHDANNTIWAEALNEGKKVVSDTVIFTLGYHPAPLIKPYAEIAGNTAALRAVVLANPWKKLSYQWSGDARNPANVAIQNAGSEMANTVIPFVDGTYYLNLLVTCGKDSSVYQTFVTRRQSTIKAFNIDTEYAAWIDSAIVYEITPYIFVKKGMYDDVTAKLPELQNLGINTIWLQPVFATHDGGQGYDITDYFSLRNDLGTEAQLQHLIQTAKSLHMHVLLDFVPNHTSINHPYAQDCIANGTHSHYYNFYQHTDDGAKYSSDYNWDKYGFVNYFWKELVNLNYDNKEVAQWMIEACKYWVKKLDIDGYRFDAVWGVNARQPQFGKQLQLELKTIKPDLLLLAEDKGAIKSVYAKGFDAAYDWTADTNWISHWSWQYDYNAKKNLTIFNSFPEWQRGNLLQQALFNNGDSTHLRLRFIENNDLLRFTPAHGIARTKMAAALEFALPGIPLVYNGQETGFSDNPYSSGPVFKRNETIQSQDKDSLFAYYQQLIAIRKSYASLRTNTMQQISVQPAVTVTAFERSNEEERIITVINEDNFRTEAVLDLSQALKDNEAAFTLRDVITNELFYYTSADKAHVLVPVNAYTTRLLILQQQQTSLITDRFTK